MISDLLRNIDDSISDGSYDPKAARKLAAKLQQSATKIERKLAITDL
jgi:hypothetical protein